MVYINDIIALNLPEKHRQGIQLPISDKKALKNHNWAVRIVVLIRQTGIIFYFWFTPG